MNRAELTKRHSEKLNKIIKQNNLTITAVATMARLEHYTVVRLIKGNHPGLRSRTIKKLNIFYHRIKHDLIKNPGETLEKYLNKIIKNAAIKVSNVGEHCFEITFTFANKEYGMRWSVRREKIETRKAIWNEAEAICRAFVKRIGKEKRVC